jgi:hypothetical protein
MLSMRVTGVTTPRMNKAMGNTKMDHRYYNTSINKVHVTQYMFERHDQKLVVSAF